MIALSILLAFSIIVFVITMTLILIHTRITPIFTEDRQKENVTVLAGASFVLCLVLFMFAALPALSSGGRRIVKTKTPPQIDTLVEDNSDTTYVLKI